MVNKCIVKECIKYSEHVVSIGTMKAGVCQEHHEALFELARKCDEEFVNFLRKYFKLAINLKKGGEIN